MRKGSVTVFIITALIAGAAWLPLAAATISTRNERNRKPGTVTDSKTARKRPAHKAAATKAPATKAPAARIAPKTAAAKTEVGPIVTVVFLQGGRPTFGGKAADVAGHFYKGLYEHSFFQQKPVTARTEAPTQGAAQ